MPVKSIIVGAVAAFAAPLAAQDASDQPVTREEPPAPRVVSPPVPQLQSAYNDPDNPSRLIPPPIPRESRPPPINLGTSGPPVKPSEPEVLPPSVTNARIVELASLCMDVVPLSSEVKPDLLWNNGWGYTRPRPYKSGAITGELVEYRRSKTSETIALVDLEFVALCRMIVRIDSPAKLAAAREALLAGLKAEPLSASDIDESFKNSVLQRVPADRRENMLISANHTIEMREVTTDLTGKNVVGADSLTMLMAEIVPLPPKFRR